MENRYERALRMITSLDPGLWKTMQDIANEALGAQRRWAGKAKAKRPYPYVCNEQVCFCGNKGVCRHIT